MNIKTVLRGNVSACMAVVASTTLAFVATAASITVDSVAQRWPWNNKVDITYTVSGGQDVAAGLYARIVFTANIGTTNITIDGVHDVGASASDGTHTVTWTLPAGLKATGCTMTAQLLSADNPSGDDYMIVDLSSGQITYEGLLATQEASNTRYNNDSNPYKTSKLVLRKVPAGTYQTGKSGQSNDTLKQWTTDKDYYIGVFEVTLAQYNRLMDSSANLANTLPAAQLTWNALRLSTTAPNEAIPAVESKTGTVLQRLNYQTGNKFGFDLPTEAMFEIAIRAGTTTDFYFGDATYTDYVVTGDRLGVGKKLPNDWGLYDMAGNLREWCLDDTSLENMADARDPFTPAYTAGTSNRRCRGGGYGDGGTNNFRSFNRETWSPSTGSASFGFRVAYVVK